MTTPAYVGASALATPVFNTTQTLVINGVPLGSTIIAWTESGGNITVTGISDSVNGSYALTTGSNGIAVGVVTNNLSTGSITISATIGSAATWQFLWATWYTGGAVSGTPNMA